MQVKIIGAGLAGKPFVYVRSAPKDHGMGNQIEGTIPEGSKVVVVEDLISTGGSSLKNWVKSKSLYAELNSALLETPQVFISSSKS